jgi:S-formylglutathione hydrolase FrmB
MAAGILMMVAGAVACSPSGAKSGPTTSPSGQTGTGYRPPRFIGLDQLAQVEAGASSADGRVLAGTTVTVQIPPTHSQFQARDALVYLPPVWFTTPAPRLGTLILLPGVPGGPTDWTDDGDADTIANEFAADHGGVAPIMVMPDATGVEEGDSECVNSTKYGNVETYLTADVPAYMRATFRAATGPDSLAVAGASAGGTCATTMSLRNPGVFPTFAAFSGFATPTYLDDTVKESIPILYEGSEAAYLAHDPRTLLEQHQYPNGGAWFEAGTGDSQPWADVRILAAASRRAGMQVCLVGIPGGHTWEVWQQSLTASLPWLSGRLGVTAPPDPLPSGCTPA